MNIAFSEDGKKFVNDLDINIMDDIREILEYVPSKDITGLEKVYFIKNPPKKLTSSVNTVATYHQFYNNKKAHIEIYLSNVITYSDNLKVVNLLYPIFKYNLAQAIFHEIGHHIEKTRAHGIKKTSSENYAITYSNGLLNLYTKNNSESLKSFIKKMNELSAKYADLSSLFDLFMGEIKSEKPLVENNIFK